MLQPDRVHLASLPTPLIRLERLGQDLGGAQVWMKRDDLTGLETSGNKVRKLEYVVADARAAGCDTLVTEGTCQSNHCRATAAVCARLGLHCVLLFRPDASSGPPQGNRLLDMLFGAEMHWFTREEFDAKRDEIVAGILSKLQATGHTPRWVPTGASEAVGCWGYIRATAELADQLHASGVHDCDVVLATSSGGTHAGTLLGKLLHRLDHWRLWGVPVGGNVVEQVETISGLCRSAIERFGLPLQMDESSLRLIDGYVGEGYGIPYRSAIEAIRHVARLEGILLDPVYTAKAFCALVDGVRTRQFGFDRPVVFLHTGGVFSNFAWPGIILERTGGRSD